MRNVLRNLCRRAHLHEPEGGGGARARPRVGVEGISEFAKDQACRVPTREPRRCAAYNRRSPTTAALCDMQIPRDAHTARTVKAVRGHVCKVRCKAYPLPQHLPAVAKRGSITHVTHARTTNIVREGVNVTLAAPENAQRYLFGVKPLPNRRPTRAQTSKT